MALHHSPSIKLESSILLESDIYAMDTGGLGTEIVLLRFPSHELLP